MTPRDQQKHEVQAATDIVRLIGEQVALRARGNKFIGLCPFHDDRNPSMNVVPAKQIYKCFSCGAGGDAFTFVMNYHKMSFPEALKYLAERAGIKLKQGPGRRAQGAAEGQDEGPSDRERIAAANAQGVEFFRTMLGHRDHGRAAREYLARRGINADMAEAFQIGYAPDRWDGLALTIGHKGWDLKGFEAAGLVSRRQREQGVSAPAAASADPRPHDFYDRLRHRLIFPIFDAIGRPIAFGGRKLRDEDEPKYLNSPETPLFNKSATLYGLHRAKKPIIDAKTAIIVEGYTDVIGCHQHGITNVVATLGTALTLQHVSQLRHYADRVVVIFDPDAAGQKASDRATEVFLQGGLDVFIAELPGEKDPDELLAEPGGLEKWRNAIENASDALEYQFRRVRERVADAGTITGRQRVIDEFLEKLVSAGFEQQSITRRGLVVRRLAELVGLPLNDLHKRIINLIQSNKDRARLREFHSRGATLETESSSHNAFATRAQQLTWRIIIGCLVRRPDLFFPMNVEEELTPAEMLGDEKSIYEMIYDRLLRGVDVTLRGLLQDLSEIGLHGLAASLTSWEAFVEEICGETSFSIEAHLQSHIDVLRFIRDHRDYIQAKAEALEISAVLDPVDHRVAKFLRFAVEFLRTHPNAARIWRGADVIETETNDKKAFETSMIRALAG